MGARMWDDEVAVFDQVAEHDEVEVESPVTPALGASPPVVVFDCVQNREKARDNIALPRWEETEIR